MASITITGQTIANWFGNTTGIQIRVFVNSSFTANGGSHHPMTVQSNPASLGTFLAAVADCTVSGTNLTIPSILLDSTTDSVDNPNASYSAVLFDTNSGKQIQSFGTYSTFTVTPTPTTTTWGNIFALGSDV